MIVTITSLRLRSLWGFFRLALHGLRVSRQAKAQPGFVKMRNTGSGYLHFTMTLWEDLESMKAFARSGAHREAMRESARLATGIRIHTYEADRLPGWKEAREMLERQGRAIAYAAKKPA